MELCASVDEIDNRNVHTDWVQPAASKLPPGKSESAPCLEMSPECQDFNTKEMQLALEYAELETRAAETMQRAAEAKRLALEALRDCRKVVENGCSRKSLDSVVCTNLPRRETIPPIFVPSTEHHDGNIGAVDSQVSNSLFGRLLTKLELPKCEMPFFDGSPAEYIAFFRQFEDQIVRNVDNDGQRLTYLRHYCTGKAKEAIRGCLMYSPEKGYAKARKILHDLFGQRHLIVQATLAEVTSFNLNGADANSLSNFAYMLANCADALEQLNYAADLNAVATMESVLLKLPRYMMNEWIRKTEDIYATGREPIFRDLCDFVSFRARLARNRYNVLLQEKSPASRRPTSVSERKLKRNFAVASGGVVGKCAACEGAHNLSDCGKFKSLCVPERWSLVIKNRICFLCLRHGHQSRSCRSANKCTVDGCTKAHHFLLHQSAVEGVSLSCKRETYNGVSLGILPVKIQGNNGHMVVNAMLDSGSDTSFVNEEIVDKLGLTGKSTYLNIATALGTKRQSCLELELTVESLSGDENIHIPTIFSVPRLLQKGVSMPDPVKQASWKHLSDIHFEIIDSTKVDLLIGLDVPEAHWVLEQRRGRRREPHADRTLLGWVLRGPIDMKISNSCRTFAAVTQSEDVQMNLQLLYDHEFADVDSFKRTLSRHDELAVAQVERSLQLKDGHFSIGLPWKISREKVSCPDSLAMHRLSHLKRRLLKDDSMKDKYVKVLQRYIEKGFAKLVPEDDRMDGMPKWYLPHHAVLNPMKPDKLRVVFDCAASYKGVSLNDNLLQGPNMIQSLVGVLLRFRRHSVAVAADIEDMFLQVKVPEVDQGALRFLWWPNGDTLSKVREYRLTVHPFGAISSPFCANFALRQTVAWFGNQYPLRTNEAILRNFYVDDCLLSLSDEDDAKALINDLQSLLAKAGFRLTKWVSSSRNVLQEIPEEERAVSVRDLDIEKLPSERALGMLWDVENDQLMFRVTLKSTPVTKRGILSQVASLYDPLGLIGPFVLPAKHVLQTLTRKGYGWDEPVEGSELESWNRWKQSIVRIKDLRVPRWYQEGILSSCTELHLFCDASEVGYGAVAYLRYVGDTYSHCSLVVAKSRVAPMKQMTIPRLELSAGVVAADIYRMLKEELELEVEAVYFWTDSTIVLYYLKNETTRYATFVANRVARILEVSRASQWNHVVGDQNPADLASRGTAVENKRLDLWFDGPPFLKVAGRLSRQEASDGNVIESDLEIKTSARVNFTLQETMGCVFARFSSWMKLVRSIVWLTRFKQYILVMMGNKAEASVKVGLIKVDELRQASTDIVRTVQHECFPTELELLCEDKLAMVRTKNSRLRKLSPILVNGLICVGGRLQWSSWTEAAKHPIILPSRHVVTDLIIQQYHEMEGHVGATQVLSAIRKKYWILRGGASVRRMVSKCLQCRRILSRPCAQVMAPLPAVRVEEIGYAFGAVGVDYFGPLYVRRGRVEEKRYGCLFTCLNIRAVHIEVAHSLSTDSFIQALSRFIARRGQPKVIYSDNGSNFKGAEAELKYCLQNWSQSKINNYLVTREIEWKFIPPEASHWGGVWERMVRSVKGILSTTIRGQRINDESLSTFLCEAERILNNRPLVPLDGDSESLEVLTPNKFLLMKDNMAYTDGLVFPKLCVRVWRKIQLLANTFWKRWKMEYLPTLQIRHKWHVGDRNLKVGDVVIVKKENTQRNQWPLGLILEVTEGGDGKVREVVLKTVNGTFKRDVRGLCLLEGM